MVVTVLFQGKCSHISEGNNNISGQEILNGLHSITGICPESVFASCNGRLVHSSDVVADGSVVRAELRTLGGKGGFGSMLRAIGAQIEKTTNREACRDLSGRRLRDINEEKRLKRWLSKKADREREAEERKQERLEKLRRQPKHDFHDPHYNKERSDLVERVSGAVEQGMKRKPAAQEGPATKKPKALWLGMDGLDTSDSSDEEDGACPVDRKIQSAQTSTLPGTSSATSSHAKSEGVADDSVPGTSSESEVKSLEQSEESNDGEVESQPSTVTSCCENEIPPEPLLDKQKTTTTKVHQETKAQEADKVDQEAKVQETDKVDQEAKVQEADKVDQEAKVQEADKVDQEAKVQEADKVGQEAKVQQADNIDQETKVQETDKVDQGTKVKETPEKDVNENLEKLQVENFDLSRVENVEELEALGMNQLKIHLSNMGLKCGGTLRERAERLWIVKGLKPEQIDPKLKAKPSKK